MFAVRGDHEVTFSERSCGLEDGAPILTHGRQERIDEERSLLTSVLSYLRLAACKIVAISAHCAPNARF